MDRRLCRRAFSPRPYVSVWLWAPERWTRGLGERFARSTGALCPEKGGGGDIDSGLGERDLFLFLRAVMKLGVLEVVILFAVLVVALIESPSNTSSTLDTSVPWRELICDSADILPNRHGTERPSAHRRR
jgi:hypothetical protein